MQVVVDSLLTQYTLEGKGKVVLILHGWGDNSAGWRQFASTLAKKQQVIVVDLPGFGGTEAPKTAWGLADYAQFVRHFLEKIDKRQVHALVGHSNGGAIAIRGLASGVLQSTKLVLLAAAGIRGEYKGRVKAMRVFTKIGKALSSPLPTSVKQKLRRKVYSRVGSDMLVAEHLQETFKKIVTDDVREDTAKLTVPTLLMYGEADEQTPPLFGEAYHQLITGSTLELLPGAGHFVHVDRPAEVTKAVQEFIDAPAA
ncbi:MAG TPA: alpha/beta hydrolase [Candidatus Saccharimonadales bacterium]|nr:alpha/beta hydrolase [Candidatus Saccharimonadales bacterium]